MAKRTSQQMGSCTSTTVPVQKDQSQVSVACERVCQRAMEEIINKQVAHGLGKVLAGVMTDPVSANVYADLVGMDSNNRKVMQAFVEGGQEAGFKALFTSPDGERPLSYAESRALYG